MRITFLLLAFLCSTFFGFSQNNIDVLHYKLSIVLNDENDSIKCQAILYFKLKENTNSVTFDLTSLKEGKGMLVSSVITHDPNKKDLKFSHNNNKIEIEGEFKSEYLQFVEILYTGIPSDGLIISKTKYGRRSFFADNWPNRGHNWFPCHEDPADKATVEYYVSAPEHYQVVANGIQMEESSGAKGFKMTYWKEDIPISTKVMVIGVADFAMNLAGVVGNIPVYTWVYPEDRNKGFYDYEMAKDILPFFINNVGPYGYKKLANVQSKTRFGGLENANTIFYSENSVSGTRKSEGLLAHEIAHQWFGNMATEKSFGHLWLSEGFATYFTILYFENKYGKDTTISMLKKDRSQVITFSKESDKAIVDTDETDYMNLLNANSYQKGGWVLHMLRRELGDSVFWRSIRKYYATYAGGIADTRDLQKVFEDVSGKNLKQFFDQWLYTTGQPDLEITWKYDTDRSLIIDIKQLQKNVFKFPLAFKINTSPGGKKEKVFVDKEFSSFKIKLDQKPTSIIVDPDTELLFKSSIKGK